MKTVTSISATGISLQRLWGNAQDLNFGEMTEVALAAASAAEDKIFEIRKAKIKAAGKQPKRTKALSEKLRTLIYMGAKQAGSFEPDKALLLVEEQLTMDEFDAATKFLTWVVENKRTFGHNLPDVWNEYQETLLTSKGVRTKSATLAVNPAN